ncbi:MAG: hypothetical protein BWY76_00244 [bacterium ADurb.Bin429]|nr:MAG: hypothetical protein BWY76_00244 [bacterium ADurb.Bin429]
MGQTRVHEGVDVYAVFANGQVAPRAFRWSGRTYTVDQVHQRWTGRNGEVRLFYFAVTAAGNAYKLCFNAQELYWMLEEVYA